MAWRGQVIMKRYREPVSAATEPARTLATVQPDLSEELRRTAAQATAFAANAQAHNTTRAYRADWADWTTWCSDRDLVALPAAPETVALYLTDLIGRGRKPATLARRLVAIAKAHELAGHDPSPTSSAKVRTVWAGIRRTVGTAQTGKAAVLVEDLRAMLAALPSSLRGKRDRALLLIGFAGAFRRAELVSLDVADLTFERAGLRVLLRKSKTDQEGKGRALGIPNGRHPNTCPVRALRAWLDAATITTGPVFRAVERDDQVAAGRLTAGVVGTVVKQAARAAGLDAAQYGGHSLRAGLATSAAAAGASERAIMAQTGHKSVTMVRRYIRDGELWRDNAAGAVGL
jgi:integrase